ncbi:MAG: hypothetical protein R3F41_00460 [Gammaproteobacteria bacterium]|nr:hypothetical protein [Pseudomonadales bacterium]
MKRLTYCTALLVPAFFSQISLAQVPLQSNFDLVADIAQAVLPLEFNPPTTTQAVDAAGSSWFVRDYCLLADCEGSGTVIAVNVTGGPGLTQGGLYVLGGSFGLEVQYLALLDDLVALALELAADFGNGGDSGDGGDSGNDGDGGDGGDVGDGSDGGDTGGGDNGVSRVISFGGSICINWVFPPTGTRSLSRVGTAAYDDDGQLTGGPFTYFEQSMFWVASADLETTTRSEQSIAAGGGQQTTVIETTSHFQIVNNLRYQTRSESTIDNTINIPGFSQQQLSSTDTVYVDPGYFVSTAYEVCKGAEWFTAATESTTTNTFLTPLPGVPTEQTITSASPESYTVIDEVNLPVTVEAGSFNTVKLTTSTDDGTSINWIDVATGVQVKMESYNPAGTLIGTNELIELTFN